MHNQLSGEKSLYLRQHAHQKVAWLPYAENSFDLAKKRDLPVLVSIGYSSCHWCQVMSRECFEDDYVSSIMNRHFTCILVDREERPDLDLIYMEAIRMFNQSAGWPLNAFCLPNGHPFWGGTYFPKEDVGRGLAPWPQVLMRIAAHFKKSRMEFTENADHVIRNLRHANDAEISNTDSWKSNLLLKASQVLCSKHDDKNGGFTPAPKFPSSTKIDFLLAIQESQSVRKNPTFEKTIDRSVQTTLEKMASGTLFDHVNGGFFRYCVDDAWQSPHFEKMLADNALLISSYSKGYRKRRNPLFKYAVEKTIRWAFTNLGSPEQGFGSSISSEVNQFEGAQYLWSKEELLRILDEGDEKDMISQWKPLEGADQNAYLPHLIASESLPLSRQIEALSKLIPFSEAYSNGVTDPKRILGWNALMVRALVDASIAFDNRDWLKHAVALEGWIASTFMEQAFAERSGEDEPPLFLDDYAFWAEALLQLCSVSESIDHGSATVYLERVERLVESLTLKFRDEGIPGFFLSPKKMKNTPPCRKKHWFDNATPSGNSSLLRIFSTLHVLTGKQKWEKEFTEAKAAYPKLVMKASDGISHALCCITEATVGLIRIQCPASEISGLSKILAEFPYRPIFLEAKKEVDQFTVCVNNVCMKPTASPEEAIRQLFG